MSINPKNIILFNNIEMADNNDEINYLTNYDEEGNIISYGHYYNRIEDEEPNILSSEGRVEAITSLILRIKELGLKGDIIIKNKIFFISDDEEAETSTKEFYTETVPSFKFKDEEGNTETEEIYEHIDKHLQSKQYERGAYLSRSIIVIVPENAGGCYDGGKSRRAKTTTVGDFKLINYMSSNNNCFFACCKLELEIKTSGRYMQKACNQIRKKYKLEADCKISPSKAIEILADKGLNCGIYNGNLTMLEGDENASVQLFLMEGHYQRMTFKQKKKKTKCADCGLLYLNKHSEKSCVERKRRRNPKNRLVRFVKMDKEKIPDLIFNKNEYVLHYDIESYVINNKQIPFIVGYVFNEEYGIFTGSDCMKQFHTFLKTKDSVHFINAYNGGSFDHYFLWDEEMKDSKVIYEQNNFLINNGSIISGMVCGKLTGAEGCREEDKDYNGKKLIDLNKHLTGSLKNNLISTGCSIAKGHIDYDSFTEWEKTTEENKELIQEYLKADVLGLKELYDKTNNVLFDKYQENICDSLTLSQMAYGLWKNKYLNKNDIYIPSVEHERFFRRSIYGGRCYKNAHRFLSSQYEDIKSKKIKYEDIDDYVFDADVVSLYPTAMKNFKYPTGKPCKTTKYFEGKMGIYQCSVISPKELLYPYLPKRIEKSLKWDVKDGRGVFTSIDIENAKTYGYKFKIECGYYWETSEYIFEDYMSEFFKAKKEAKKGTPAYTTAKLFLNALYGKMIQKPIHSKNKYVSTYDELAEVLSANIITEYEEIGNKIYIAYSPRDSQDLEFDIKKPTHIGAFILSHSRTIMKEYYDQINPKNKLKEQFYYTDTDAMVFHASQLDRVKLSKDLGGLDDDVGGKIIRAYWIAPKLYAYEYIKPDLTFGKHIRGKGIKTNNIKNANIAFNDFIELDKGKERCLTMDFNMRRIHNKVNNKDRERGYENFNIIMTYNNKKVINRTLWKNREFIDDNWSIPHGHAYSINDLEE